MAMSIFPLDMTPITENLSVIAAEVQPLIVNLASDENLRGRNSDALDSYLPHTILTKLKIQPNHL